MNAEREWEISAIYDGRHAAQAEALVLAAMGAIKIGAPGFSRIHAKRVARMDRLHSAIRDLGMVTAIVAQWMSAKEQDRAGPDAKSAIASVAELSEQVILLQQQIGVLGQRLRYADKNTAGDEVSDMAEMANSALCSAVQALLETREGLNRMVLFMPIKAIGRAGLLGSMRDLPPDAALARDLGHLWFNYGLSLSGGEDGDGLDIFLCSLLGDVAGKKALTSARRSLSTEIYEPK